MNTIEALAIRQLAAYNAANLDDFMACYHPEVQVFHGDTLNIEGTSAMRERYLTLFSTWRFGASVPSRLSVEPHCVDYETYWRVDPETGERDTGEVLARYTERDGLIGTVQFLGD